MQAGATTLAEVMTAVLDCAEEIRKIEAISTDQPLASRLVAVIDILDAYNRRVRASLDDLVRASGPAIDTTDLFGIRPPGRRDKPRSLDSRTSEIREAVVKLLEPDQQHLRFPAQVLAAVFVGMTLDGIRRSGPDRPPLSAEQVVDLFLHGSFSAG